MTHEAERIPSLICFDDLECRLVVWKVARLSKCVKSCQVWTHNTKTTRDLPHWIRLVYSTIQISDVQDCSSSTVKWSTEIYHLFSGVGSHPRCYLSAGAIGGSSPTDSIHPGRGTCKRVLTTWVEKTFGICGWFCRIFNDLKQHKEILERWPNWTRQI